MLVLTLQSHASGVVGLGVFVVFCLGLPELKCERQECAHNATWPASFAHRLSLLDYLHTVLYYKPEGLVRLRKDHALRAQSSSDINDQGSVREFIPPETCVEVSTHFAAWQTSSP